MKALLCGLVVGTAAFFVPGGEAKADDYWYRGPWGGSHADLHDELEHREFHRDLAHRRAHRYPMTWRQHEHLHDELDHDRFHDHLLHRQYHRHYRPYYGGWGHGHHFHGGWGYGPGLHISRGGIVVRVPF